MIFALVFTNTVFFWIVAILGFLMMIASILYATKYYRCPHCGTQLDPRGRVPNFCPNCGKELNWFFLHSRRCGGGSQRGRIFAAPLWSASFDTFLAETRKV